MKKLFFALMLLSFSVPAFAQESNNKAAPDPNYKMLDLYPKGRAAYLEKSETQAEKYQAQGYDFVERLYDERGEGGTSSSAPPMPEAEVDAYIESTQTPAETAEPAQ